MQEVDVRTLLYIPEIIILLIVAAIALRGRNKNE